jgi:choline kinase
VKAVILCAGVGSRLHPFTADRPKALVEVAGKPLLHRTLDRLAEVDIVGPDVIVVGGYRHDVLKQSLDRAGRRCTLVFNEKFEEWNNFWSLYVAREAVGASAFLQLDGDVLFDGQVLPRVLGATGDALLAVDVREELDDETMKVQAEAGGRIRAVSKKLDPKTCVGEYIGVTRIAANASRRVFDELLQLSALGLTNEYYEHAYHRLTGRGEVPFGVVDVGDCAVTEIDDAADLRRAESLIEEREVA